MIAIVATHLVVPPRLSLSSPDVQTTMSFNNAFNDDLEQDEAVQDQYRDFPEFEKLSAAIENNLVKVKNILLVAIRDSLQRHDALDKSAPDYQQNAQRLSDSLKDSVTQCVIIFKGVNKSTSDLNEYLRLCELDHADEDTVSYLRQKESILISSTKNALHMFQRQQRKCLALEKSLVASLAVIIEDATNPRRALQSQGQLLQQQDQLQIQITYEPINAEELERQLLLIQEREREILQISQDTQEINEIYLNLQGIIQEQQFQIDSIEDNILCYHGDVQGAANELRRAERYQRRSGGRILCCLFILLAVFGSVVLVIAIF